MRCRAAASSVTAASRAAGVPSTLERRGLVASASSAERISSSAARSVARGPTLLQLSSGWCCRCCCCWCCCRSNPPPSDGGPSPSSPLSSLGRQCCEAVERRGSRAAEAADRCCTSASACCCDCASSEPLRLLLSACRQGGGIRIPNEYLPSAPLPPHLELGDLGAEARGFSEGGISAQIRLHDLQARTRPGSAGGGHRVRRTPHAPSCEPRGAPADRPPRRGAPPLAPSAGPLPSPQRPALDERRAAGLDVSLHSRRLTSVGRTLRRRARAVAAAPSCRVLAYDTFRIGSRALPSTAQSGRRER